MNTSRSEEVEGVDMAEEDSTHHMAGEGAVVRIQTCRVESRGSTSPQCEAIL